MDKTVDIIGAGLAGSEAALQLASRGVRVRLHEMRPVVQTAVHHGSDCAELVCSNSLKSTKPESAAGMLKAELAGLGSFLIEQAGLNRVDAGGALAVDRDAFSAAVTRLVREHSSIEYVVGEVDRPPTDSDAVVLAAALTSDALASWVAERARVR